MDVFLEYATFSEFNLQAYLIFSAKHVTVICLKFNFRAKRTNKLARKFLVKNDCSRKSSIQRVETRDAKVQRGHSWYQNLRQDQDLVSSSIPPVRVATLTSGVHFGEKIRNVDNF